MIYFQANHETCFLKTNVEILKSSILYLWQTKKYNRVPSDRLACLPWFQSITDNQQTAID